MKIISLIITSIITLNMTAQTNYELISQDFLYAVRVGDDYTTLLADLENVEEDVLIHSLNTENKKKAFWLNIYNAFIQIKAKENPEMIKNSRNDFFSNKWITIAKNELSFDDIEHGMIRNSQWKYGMGYLGAWFPSKFEKNLRVENIDYRIHFALNCGAAGCPPIAFYNSEKLEEQLTTATAGFLELNSIYNEAENTVEVSKILSWFKGDFGGIDGIKNILKEYQIIPEESNPKITFKEYDWTVSLSNYTE